LAPYCRGVVEDLSELKGFSKTGSRADNCREGM